VSLFLNSIEAQGKKTHRLQLLNPHRKENGNKLEKNFPRGRNAVEGFFIEKKKGVS